MRSIAFDCLWCRAGLLGDTLGGSLARLAVEADAPMEWICLFARRPCGRYVAGSV
jgi:hypothetical protein